VLYLKEVASIKPIPEVRQLLSETPATKAESKPAAKVESKPATKVKNNSC
jgi:hypothetical protein